MIYGICIYSVGSDGGEAIGWVEERGFSQASSLIYTHEESERALLACVCVLRGGAKGAKPSDVGARRRELKNIYDARSDEKLWQRRGE